MKTKPKTSNMASNFLKLDLEMFKEQHNDASLTKLMDKHHSKKDEVIVFKMKRIIEIVTSGAPCPYAIHEEGETEISIIPAFEAIDKLVEKIRKIIATSDKGSFGDTSNEMMKLILEDSSKKKFDKSRLESINEKSLTSKQIIARRIMPLVSIIGMIYVTNKNLYFQPLHAEASKPVKIIHFEDIVNIFRRRFELRHVIRDF
jgi:factor associated with neutral sphingomyelinase activation